jgi:hypothetical protein
VAGATVTPFEDRDVTEQQSQHTYGWKQLADGQIVQGHYAPSAADLFEAAGFGAVDTDKPVKGHLAVRVREIDGIMVEVNL